MRRDLLTCLTSIHYENTFSTLADPPGHGGVAAVERPSATLTAPHPHRSTNSFACCRRRCCPTRRAIRTRRKVLVRRAGGRRGRHNRRSTCHRRSRCCCCSRAPDGSTQWTDNAVALAVALLGPDGHAVVVEAVVTAGAGGEPLLACHLAEADGTEGVVVAVVVVLLLLHRRARGGGLVVVIL
jgi:hypothetical protein